MGLFCDFVGEIFEKFLRKKLTTALNAVT